MTMVFELEIPAVYLDALVLDPTPARPALINQDPEPGEVEIPLDTAIALDLTDVGGAGIDLLATKVFVAGELAFDGGVFSPAYAGQGSSASNPQLDTLRIVVDPSAPFASLQQVLVRVVTQTADKAFQLDTTWTFRCQDLTAPQIVGAQARELKRVRVSFDENVKQIDANATDDALNPACYQLTPQTAPSVGASVIGVETITGSAVELLTDTELTPGATYRLEVAGVVDLFGNAIAPPSSSATFSGFVPARPLNRRFDLYSLLPEMNRREDDTEDLRRFLSCLQEVTDLLLAGVDGFTDILDPDRAAEVFLDLMLAELGNPFPFDLSLVDKRRLLNILVAIYREKGTAAGIRNAIRFFLDLEVDITAYAGEALILGESLVGEDWILGPSMPFSSYAFEVVVPRALTDEERRRLRAVIDYMKPAHTHFARLVEPVIPEVIDHLELGLSELGENWMLH